MIMVEYEFFQEAALSSGGATLSAVLLILKGQLHVPVIFIHQDVRC